MLVMDASGSMRADDAGGTTRIQAARDALHTVVADLPADQPVGMRVPGATVQGGQNDPRACTDSQRVVDLGTDNRDQLDQAIDKYAPKGDTPIGHALQEAGKDLKDADGTRTVLLVSDGLSTCEPDLCEIAADLAGKGIDAEVHTVGLNVNPQARKQLQCIADKGNGQYHDVQDTTELTEAVQQIATRARRDFRVTGQKVEGSETLTAAPVLEVGTTYQDTLPANHGVKFYRVNRSIAESTLRATASAAAKSAFHSIRVSLLDRHGNACDMEPDMGRTQPSILSPGAVTTYEPEKPFTTADHLYVEVETLDEGMEGKPVELLLSEEPPADEAGLPEATRDAKWQEMPEPTSFEPVTGGATFADAPRLEPGKSYSTDVRSGESAVFRVPVGWGQHLQAEGTVDFTGTDANAFAVVTMDLFGADRSSLFMTPSNLPGDPVAMGNKVAIVQDMSSPVLYANRSMSKTSSLAGDHYVVVNADFGNDSEQTPPLALTVDAVGEVSGEPQYLTSGGEPSGDASSGASSSAGEGSSATEPSATSDSDQTSPSGAPSSSPTTDPDEASATGFDNGKDSTPEGDEQAAGDQAGDDDGLVSPMVLWGLGGLGVLALLGGIAALLVRR